MGSSAAWWLARRGLDVVVLEQFEAGHVRGSSHGSSRIFRLAYPDRRYVAMAAEALPLWGELSDEAGVALLRTVGGLDHGYEPSVRAVADAMAAEGVAHSWLSAEEAAARWPGLVFTSPVLFQPDAGSTDARSTVAALQRLAAARGAELHFSTPVLDVAETPSGVRVTTAAEEFVAPVAVVAGGAWMPRLVAGLEPIVVTQEQVFHFSPRTAETEWPTFIHHQRPFMYGLPAPSPEGIKVAEHHTGAPVDPDTRDFAIDPAGQARVVDYVERWLPGLDPGVASAATCLYANTATEDFIIERRGNLVIAAGFSGHGFKFTPLVGRLLADLATP
jgi:sarcosine oxidase